MSEASLPDDLRQELESRMGGVFTGGEVRFRCPAHNDQQHPSASWNGTKKTWFCRTCGAGGGWVDLCNRWGIPLPDLRPPRPAGRSEYVVRDANGKVYGTKVREDDGQGNKKMYWLNPNGDTGLGRSTAELPLYGIDGSYAPNQARIVVEGESSADALSTYGFCGLGTVTGANVTPGREALEALRGYDVFLWPDNDGPGRSHMGNIAQELIAMGIPCSFIDWPEAPPKGDAVDFIDRVITGIDEQGSDVNTRVRIQTAIAELLDNATPVPMPRKRIYPADELMALDIPLPKFPVPGLVAEGLCILAGRPKMGKSWLALQFALGVAGGGSVLGSIEVETGDVLYLALEDTHRRLQSRINRLLNGAPPPSRLHLAVSWPKFGSGGEDMITNWLDEHPEARLVIIDTLQKVRPMASEGSNVYANDYVHGETLKAIGDKYAVGVVVLHHTRKTAAEDPLESISGSNGLPGAADTILVMNRDRGSKECKLFVTGRDVEEGVVNLTWDPRTIWKKAEASVGDLASQVARVLRHGKSTVGRLADAVCRDQEVVEEVLRSHTTFVELPGQEWGMSTMQVKKGQTQLWMN